MRCKLQDLPDKKETGSSVSNLKVLGKRKANLEEKIWAWYFKTTH
jgi:hypothetical protein